MTNMEYLNKVVLKGVIGSIKPTVVSDTNIIYFTVCTQYSHKDENGNIIVETTWHQCSYSTKTDFPFKKGDTIHLFGRIKQSRYIDSSGNERIMNTIIVNDYLPYESNLPKYYGDEDKVDL